MENELTRETRLAAILTSSREMIAAIEGAPDIPQNLYHEVLGALREMATEEGIPIAPIALIGGGATIYHGYPRSTQDLDITVSVPDFDRIIKVCHSYGFRIVSWNPTGMHELEYKGIPIEVIQERFWGPDEHGVETPPHPRELGVESGLGFANLPGWTFLKLGADRAKDNADIVEVFKKKTPQEIAQVSEFVYDKSPAYYDKLGHLLGQVEREKKSASRDLSRRGRK